MRLFKRELSGIPKALVVLVTVLLIASGLCGITTTIESLNHWSFFGPGLPNTPLGNTLIFVDLSAYAAFMISGLLIVVLLVAWPVLTLMEWLYVRFGSQQRNVSQSIYGLASRIEADAGDLSTKWGGGDAQPGKPSEEDQP
jgi:hypothetical protein